MADFAGHRKIGFWCDYRNIKEILNRRFGKIHADIHVKSHINTSYMNTEVCLDHSAIKTHHCGFNDVKSLHSVQLRMMSLLSIE